MRVVGRGWAALLTAGLAAAAAGCGDDETTGRGPDSLEMPTIQLTGDQEVPPTTTQATGEASATLTGNLLRVTGSFEGLSSPLQEVEGSAAHVHDAPMGQAGPIVFNVTVMPAADNRSGTFDGEMLLDDAQLRAFRAGRYYVNVHTQMNPSGEIRGQLTDMPAETEPPVSLSRIPAPPSNVPGDRIPDERPTLPTTNGFPPTTPPAGGE